MKFKLVVAALLTLVLFSPLFVNLADRNVWLRIQTDYLRIDLGAYDGYVAFELWRGFPNSRDAPLFDIDSERRRYKLQLLKLEGKHTEILTELQFPFFFLLIIPLAIVLIPTKQKEETADSPTD